MYFGRQAVTKPCAHLLRERVQAAAHARERAEDAQFVLREGADVVQLVRRDGRDVSTLYGREGGGRSLSCGKVPMLSCSLHTASLRHSGDVSGISPSASCTCGQSPFGQSPFDRRGPDAVETARGRGNNGRVRVSVSVFVGSRAPRHAPVKRGQNIKRGQNSMGCLGGKRWGEGSGVSD